jgi:hypothetical protein
MRVLKRQPFERNQARVTLRRLFTLGEDAFQVLVHGRHGNPEQLGDQGLTQPDYVGLEAALDARAAVLGLVEDDAGFRRSVACPSNRRNSINP